MMDIRMYETGIKEYLAELTRYGKTPPSKKELAKILGVTEGCLNHWLSGRRSELKIYGLFGVLQESDL